VALYHEGKRIDAVVKRTDGDYWRILDFRFLEGGPYSAADDDAGRLVAVITDDMRERLFDGGPALGRTFTLEGRSFRVIGVVPRVPSTRLIAYSQIWIPIGTMKSAEYRTQLTGSFAGAVLARDRADIPALQRAFADRMPSVPLVDPKRFTTTRAGLDTPFEYFARIFGGADDTRASAARLRVILGVLAVLFMALPALNLITLNLSRILERAPEIGVRRAFGAPRLSLVRQFVFENMVVTVIGGLGGFAIAALLLPVLNRYAPVPDVDFGLNLRVFGWGMLLAIVFALLSGVYPAWRMSRLNPVNALRGGSQ
jgi:putative ABC transport system permease protein